MPMCICSHSKDKSTSKAHQTKCTTVLINFIWPPFLRQFDRHKPDSDYLVIMGYRRVCSFKELAEAGRLINEEELDTHQKLVTENEPVMYTSSSVSCQRSS